MPNVNELPNDIALLKRIVAEERRERDSQFQRMVTDRDSLIQRMATERDSLIQRMATERDSLIQRIREEADRQLEAERERHEAEMKAAIAALLRRYYGPRSERFDPRQMLLFGRRIVDAELDTASIEEESGEELVTRRVKKRHKHGRQQLPEHLERIEIEHDVDDAEKACPECGCERCRIGSEISEQLVFWFSVKWKHRLSG